MKKPPQNPDLVYDTHIFCCTNQRPPQHPRGCCAAKDSIELSAYLKKRAWHLKIAKIRINQTGCLNRCELGPTLVIYPEATWYTYATEQDLDEILESHILQGKKVDRLLLATDQRQPGNINLQASKRIY